LAHAQEDLDLELLHWLYLKGAVSKSATECLCSLSSKGLRWFLSYGPGRDAISTSEDELERVGELMRTFESALISSLIRHQNAVIPPLE